jgi:hypothetical protein
MDDLFNLLWLKTKFNEDYMLLYTPCEPIRVNMTVLSVFRRRLTRSGELLGASPC